MEHTVRNAKGYIFIIFPRVSHHKSKEGKAGGAARDKNEWRKNRSIQINIIFLHYFFKKYIGRDEIKSHKLQRRKKLTSNSNTIILQTEFKFYKNPQLMNFSYACCTYDLP